MDGLSLLGKFSKRLRRKRFRQRSVQAPDVFIWVWDNASSTHESSTHEQKDRLSPVS